VVGPVVIDTHSGRRFLKAGRMLGGLAMEKELDGVRMILDDNISDSLRG
jgi:hypothetical protein